MSKASAINERSEYVKLIAGELRFVTKQLWVRIV